jgi:hypothetical protein
MRGKGGRTGRGEMEFGFKSFYLCIARRCWGIFGVVGKEKQYAYRNNKL